MYKYSEYCININSGVNRNLYKQFRVSTQIYKLIGGEDMKKTIAMIVCLMVTMTFIVSGCGTFGSAPSGEQVLRVNNSEEPGSLNPQKAQGTHDSWVLEHCFEGLTKKTVEGKIVPGMAKKDWKISPDGLTWTFTLRDDIKWSNGDPVTAQDFEYAWSMVLVFPGRCGNATVDFISSSFIS